MGKFDGLFGNTTPAPKTSGGGGKFSGLFANQPAPQQQPQQPAPAPAPAPAKKGIFAKIVSGVVGAAKGWQETVEVASANLSSGIAQAAGSFTEGVAKFVLTPASKASSKAGETAYKGIGEVVGLISPKGENFFDDLANDWKTSNAEIQKHLGTIGKDANYMFSSGGREVKEVILKDNKGYQEHKKNTDQKFELSDLGKKDFLLYDLFGSLVENAPTMALTLYTGGKMGGIGGGKAVQLLAQVGGTTMFSNGINALREGESAYTQALNEGKSKEEAVTESERVISRNFAGNMGLEAAQMLLIFAPQLRAASPFINALGNTAKYLGAGAIEAGQERMEDAIQNQSGDEDFKFRQLLDEVTAGGITKTDAISFILGMAFQGMGNVFIDEETVKRGVEEQANLILEQLPPDTAGSTGSPVERLEQALEKDPAAVQEAAGNVQQQLHKGSEPIQKLNDMQEARNLVGVGLDEGLSPARIALELSGKLGTAEAEGIVSEVVAERGGLEEEASTEVLPEPAAGIEPTPRTALEDTNKRLAEINEKVLEKTPADMQTEFSNLQEQFDTKVSALQSDVQSLKEQVSQAEPNTPAKKQAKKDLAAAQAKLARAEEEFTQQMTNEAQGLRDFLATYIPENFDVKLSKDQLESVIDDIAIQITDPEAIKKTFNTPIKAIVGRQIQRFANKKAAPAPVEEYEEQEFDVPAAVEAEAAEDWQENHAEEYGKQSAEAAKLQEDLKNAKKSEQPAIKKKLDEVNKKMAGTEEAFIKKWRGKAGIVDKDTTKQDTKDNEQANNDSGADDNAGGVPEPLPDSPEQSDGTGSPAPKPRSDKRRGKQPPKRSDKSGERSGTRLTNEQVAEVVSSVTSVSDNGEVTITGEITEEVLEAANQYKTGGTEKAGRGILDEYYTSSQIVDLVKSLFDFPATSLKVLEPAVGAGNFIYALPDIGKHDITAHEINDTTARIAKIFHQNAKVFTTSFEENFIDERGNAKEFTSDYDLVIGNPPYGDHRGKYRGLGEEKKISRYEEYFMKRGIDVLKDGGILAMVVPSGFLQGGSTVAKEAITLNAELVDAFRLPNGVFEGTDVGTDIVVFKKAKSQSSVDQNNRLKTITGDNFFRESPQNVLGEIKERKGRFGQESFVEGSLESATALFYERHNEREAIKVLKELGLPETSENIETAEEAVEEAGTEAAALVKAAKKQGKKTIEKKVVKKSVKTGEPVSLVSQFEGQYTDAELELWRRTQPDGSIAGIKDFKDTDPKITNYLNGKWYLDFNYLQGDIYEKLAALERDKDKIPTHQYSRQKEKLEAVLPKRETIDDLKLSPSIVFVKETVIRQTDEGNNVTLQQAFLSWLDELPSKAFGTSTKWEVNEYVREEPVRGSDKDRNELVRVRRKIVADDLFSKFLKSGLATSEKAIVEDKYNETFNFYHTPDYKKVPMFSQVHATFKGEPLEVRDVQKHGIGRLVSTGVGILAHDVGFGKTMSGVLAINESMHRGWAKRPLVVAPNENVYRQWISTIEDLIPNAQLNLLGNLGVSYKGDLSSLAIPDGSITLLTYEGFKRLGFSDETYERMGGKFTYIADDLDKHKTEREKQKARAAEAAQGGVMKRGTRADLSFEKLGFDHITFDEVHNANHIVSKVKMPEGKTSEFNRFNLRPSDLGIKTWLAAQYIQENNDGRNVNLLSATPFTNHPLEYYSILSLVADKSLQKMGIQNVNDFFGTFMEAENEYEFKADGTYQKKTDIRRFRNFRQFRKLLDTYIDFKEGDAEGIVRPTRVQQTYEIPQNQFGLDMEAQAQAIFQEDEKQAGQGAKVLRAITELRKIAFSPYASKFAADISPDQYKEFVDNSPKIKVLMELIRQNKADKPEAGQLVYVDQVGVQFMPLMKEYMVKELGYSADQVEIISGATDKVKRVEIQDKYNAGEVKIIIGSEAIKEGMNLQVTTSDLYILSLPWNFTQLRQVIGRAWRQGNIWSNVRINNLFIQDSIDIFLSQKLENKQKRYEAAIKSADNEVDVGDVSFDQLKFDLIRDPETRAKLELQAEKERLAQEITQQEAELAFATRKADKLQEFASKIAEYQGYLDEETARQDEAVKKGEERNDYWINNYAKQLADFKKKQSEELAKLKEKDIDTAGLEKIQTEGMAKIADLKEQEKGLADNFDTRVKEIAATLPERKPFSPEIITSLVAERAEQNKTFYQLKAQESADTITVQEEVKEIKNTAGTKVVKTKKTAKAVRTKKTDKTAPTKDAATFAVLNDPALSTTEKVDKLLDVKQKGKEFKDIGERVAGSKKERAAIRAVMESGSGDVFAEMINRLGLEAVLDVLDKNEILDGIETPNPEKDRADGVPAMIAFAKKDIYDKIQRRFSFRQGRGKYKDFVAWKKEEEESYGRGWTSLDERDSEYAAEVIKEYPALLREFVAKLTAVKTPKDMADFGAWYNDSYKEREIGRLYNQVILVSKNVFGDAVANYRPFTPWFYSGNVQVTRNRGFHGFAAALEEAMKEGRIDLFNKEMNSDKWWEKATKKGGKREEGVDMKHGNFKPLERVDRSAPAISDERVNPQTLQTDYGFKSVQFGNYMDDATSREHIRHTIGALEDMAEALDLDIPKMIAETGLSMAYGARGGGGANAHYEPSKNIINLTKGRGDGSFFHEFVHYMDMKLAEKTYRGKWSSKKTRYYRSDAMDAAALDLMDALTGRHTRKVKEFTPQEDPYIRDSSPVLQWYREGKPFEEAVEEAKKGVYEYQGNTKVYKFTEGELLRNVADVYRKTVSAEVEVWNDDTNYHKSSRSFGGDYWSRPEELLARAGQAYIEDKMAEKGMKNNYLTRSTITEFEGDSLSRVYPQGEERKQFNEKFDALFDVLRAKFPRGGAKFKQEGAVEPEYTLTDAGRYLADVKERLNLDFDVFFVESIMHHGLNGKIEAYGAMADNTIAIARDLAKYTAEHEVVHLTLANLNRIPTFKRQGITRDRIMDAKAAQMGIERTGETELEIEEKLADDFEAFMENRGKPQGIIRKFFALLRVALLRFARAIGATRGDIIADYYETLAEGKAVDEEMVRLENQGIFESFINDDELDLSGAVALKSVGALRIDNFTKDELIEAIDYIRLKLPYNQRIEENIGYLAEKFDVSSTVPGTIANKFEALVEETQTYDIAGRVVLEPRFKVKGEKDAHVRRLKKQFNELLDKQESLEENSEAWRTQLQQEAIRKEEAAAVVSTTPEKVKEATRFTNRKKDPVGQLTERGVSEVESLGFANPEEAQAEINAYLKRKVELVETRKRLRSLRTAITNATREGKATARALRDVERRLKLRRRLLEQKDFYVGMGVNRGKKEQMKVIARRRRAVRLSQDAFGIGDAVAKKIIGNRQLQFMTEAEFNDFLLEFANRAESAAGLIKAKDTIKALLQSKQFNKEQNLARVLGVPSFQKAAQEVDDIQVRIKQLERKGKTEEVAKLREKEEEIVGKFNQLVEILSKYQIGDTFLTTRQLETIHRTQWGDIKTERELIDKLKEHTGTGAEELKTLTAPPTHGYFTPWLRLARSHPFFNWLVSKRIEAMIKAEREYTSIEEEINKLSRKARSSRRKQMNLKEKAIETIIATDDLVFGYMEAENKPDYAEKNKMTNEELAFAQYLINLYHGAYEYMTSEYGMRGRENYMTHSRRSFMETLKESGIKEAFSEVFAAQKENEAAFKILDEQTGKTVAFEKFFRYALQRTGGLTPSKNVTRVALGYFNAFAKKKALDEFVPEAMVAVQAHKAVTGTTDKGLSKDPSLEEFVKRFLNDAKGRKVFFGTEQGSNTDIGLRALISWISIKYLGLNLATAVASFVGDFTSVFWELSVKEAATGLARTVNIRKTHQLNKDFRFFTGRNPIVELFDPQYSMPSRLLSSIMVLMSLASFQSSKFFLRSKMTQEEWEKGLVDDQRLTEIAKSLSRVKPNKFYVRSLAGNTTLGKANFQFGSWAVAIFNTVISDAGEVRKMLKDKKGWDTVKSDEFQKLAKFGIMAGMALVAVQLLQAPDDDDDSMYAQVLRKARRELTTLTQALAFVSDPGNYLMAWEEISNWSAMVKMLISQERYKQDGEGYGMGDLKWITALERLVTPSILKNLNPPEDENTKERLLKESIKSGEFNPDEMIDFLYEDTLAEKSGDELEDYRKAKTGELTALRTLYEKYPDSRVGQILIEENANKDRVDKLIEYSREVGADAVWEEVRTLYKDRDLCANPKSKTGCLISDKLFKEYRKAKNDM